MKLTPLSTFKATLTDPQVYRRITHQPVKASLAYFIVWYLGISFCLAMIINLAVLPHIKQSAELLIDRISSDLPAALTLSFNEGKLSLLPEGISTPIVFTNPLPNTAIQKLLVIDPSVTAETIVQNTTLFLLTENALAVRPSPPDDDFTVFELQQLVPEPLTLNVNDISQALSASRQMISALYDHRWWLLPLLTAAALLLSRFFFLVVYTLPLLLIAVISGRSASLINCWKLGLHTIVLTDLILFIVKFLYQQPLNWLYAPAFLGISTIALLTLKPQAVQNHPA